MKKNILLFIVFLFLILVGCAGKGNSNILDSLPILEGSKLISKEDVIDDKPKKANYSLEKADMIQSAVAYKKLLEDSGWKIDKENSPSDTVFKYVKDDHWVVVIFKEGDNSNIIYSLFAK